MKLYCAPLEGITDDIFRRVHQKYYPGVDMYYTPFLSPTTTGPALTKRDGREVLPENNRGVPLVPQILTNKEVELLLAQPERNDAKGYRDSAMLETLYATGIRVTELIDLNLEDVNLEIGIIKCCTDKNHGLYHYILQR